MMSLDSKNWRDETVKKKYESGIRTGRAIGAIAIGGCAAAIATAVSAQNAAPAETPTITELTVVDYQQIGNPPTGPYAVVIEHDPGLATHTIYRPAELTMDEHPVLVWGEGGCANNGLMFPEYLSEIASYGFVVIADGPPGSTGAGRGGPNDPGVTGARQGGAPGAAPGGAAPAPRAGGPGGQARAGGPPGDAPAGAGGGRAGGGPGPGAGNAMVNGTDLVAAIDWLADQADTRRNRFRNKVDVENVAAMGMSCGGLMSYGASNDPRVATVGIWNSGLFPDEANANANADIYNGIHGSVIIVTGGESDIAYANGKRDFEVMPASVPTFYGVYPSVGHGGTYNQDNGGPYGIAAVAWLKWQLMGDTSAAGRGFFVGPNCGICGDSNWKIDSRSLP
jgi:hypothetical protein